ncbi:fatty-acid amide hydrolase 1 [Plakobranchus ocellatus]|uniref:Fatty-acid amide hydrolase 1 n=1 Tax=Plakobranchus ocellatus TaxID=259542 RepID=A0AAV4A6Y4_9GAST|nr:fatty-acid amide hydrolase 1 [Plakobranchus ocellatus]
MAEKTDIYQYFIDYFDEHPHSGLGLACLVVVAIGTILSKRWRQKKRAQKRRKKRQKEAKARTKLVHDKVAHIYDADDIVQKPILELTDDLTSGQLTPIKVLNAFQNKALAVTNEINCVIEPITEAEEWANALEASATPKGLLYGIPISLKENVAIEGYDSTLGTEVMIGDVSHQDSVIVKVLKNQGAIPFMRTNVPQTLLSIGSDNPIYGNTLHPHDPDRGPGGSSTGEGVLIGGGGSVIGIGTDVGGTLRVPAEFCGAFCLSPTRGRVSCDGLKSLVDGNPSVRQTFGPMARDFDSLVLASRALLCPLMYDLDPTLAYMPFDDKQYEQTSPLRIGYFTSTGTIQCQPPNVRAVMEAKAALEVMGHKVIPFDFPAIMGEPFDGEKYFLHLVLADRLRNVKDKLKHDRVIKHLDWSILFSRVPKWLLKLIKFIVKRVEEHSGSVLGALAGFGSIQDYFKRLEEVQVYKDKFLDTWRSLDLDAAICPVFPSPAVTLDTVTAATREGFFIRHLSKDTQNWLNSMSEYDIDLSYSTCDLEQQPQYY